MQIYDFTLAVNQSRPLEAPGTYCYYYAGSAGGADATLVIKEDTNGTTIRLAPGQAFRLPKGSRPATRWYISNFANVSPITGFVVIGDGEITDNRVTGEVSVVDGEKARTLLGGMFTGSANCAADAVNVSLCQLWNPSATKNLIVTNVSFGCNGTNGILIVTNAAALATDQSATRLINKLAGSAVGAGQVRVGIQGAAPAAAIGQAFNVAAASTLQWPIRGAVVLPPSKGLLVCGTNVNTQVAANFEWFEEGV